MTAQGSHSSLGVFLQMMNNGKSLREEMPEIVNGSYSLKLDVTVGSDLDNWLRGVFRKITLAVNSEEELMDIYYHRREDLRLKEQDGRSPASRWGMNRPFSMFF